MILLFAVFGCGVGVPCTIEDQAWALVPADATDCGEDLSCLATAMDDGRPAVAMSSIQGTDSVFTTAHVWTGDRFWWLSRESMSPSSVDGRECIGPQVVNGEIECDSVAPEGNHYAVCGNQGGGSPAPLPFEP